MIRKISTKAPAHEQQHRRLELKTSDNEYYLPHPQVRIIKTPTKEISFDNQGDKLQNKFPRKGSQQGPMRTYSTSNFKSDINNISKDQDPPNLTKNNAARKVETRKMRCTSNVETPRKLSSKSAFKLQLNHLKKDRASKRLNLKIETPTTKKSDKVNLRSANFDSYYNEGGTLESKTARAPKHP
jgi:hypothetical protein